MSGGACYIRDHRNIGTLLASQTKLRILRADLFRSWLASCRRLQIGLDALSQVGRDIGVRNIHLERCAVLTAIGFEQEASVSVVRSRLLKNDRQKQVVDQVLSVRITCRLVAVLCAEVVDAKFQFAFGNDRYGLPSRPDLQPYRF